LFTASIDPRNGAGLCLNNERIARLNGMTLG